jgi:hypothetical protein
MNILLVKSVFAPNDKYLNVMIKSLIKINIYIQCLKKYNITFDLLLVGWAHKYVDTLNLLFKMVKFEFENVYTEYWGINYGKYKVLNFMIEFANTHDGYDNYIYMDHDIHFDILTVKNFKKIIHLNNLIVYGKEIGICAFNQKGDVRHQPIINENVFDNDSIQLIWSNMVGSIATGSFIIKPHILKSLKTFELKSVYGLDDYLLCKQLEENKMINVVISNCYVYHPYDDNEKYKLWKKNNIIKTINNDINYYNNIEDSMNLHL